MWTALANMAANSKNASSILLRGGVETAVETIRAQPMEAGVQIAVQNALANVAARRPSWPASP